MKFPEAFSFKRLGVVGLVIGVALVCFTACSSGVPLESSTNESSKSASELEGDYSASDWLMKAQAAARQMNKYGFELQMSQKLSGTEQADNSTVKINMLGRVEREPLKLDQTIKSTIDGESSTLRAVIVPDAYYMYLPEYEEWSKLPKEIREENISTLSDFQVNPEQALIAIQTLGSAMTVEKKGEVATVRYEGIGPEVTVFLAKILESTMGLSGMASEIQKSLVIQRLSVVLNLDAQKNWPLSYRIESSFTIEFEPGHQSEVSQTLAGTYSKHNASAAVTVPKEAQGALDPDKIDEELGRAK